MAVLNNEFAINHIASTTLSKTEEECAVFGECMERQESGDSSNKNVEMQISVLKSHIS